MARPTSRGVVERVASTATAIATATSETFGRITERRQTDPVARRRRFWQHTLPLVLLGGLVLAALVTIFLRADLYGITIDEPTRDLYGRNIYNWYTTLGHDTSFLTAFPLKDREPEHGGIFDGVVYAIQIAFPAELHWSVRHIVTALFGWVGLIAIALCGYELSGAWVALVAALGLWLYPRYYGAIYNNPKDVPAAVTLTFALWATLILVKHWNRGEHRIRDSVLVGCAVGVATAIRGNSIIWFGVLMVLLAGWWALHGMRIWRERRILLELRHAVVAAGVIGTSFLLTTMALWPYVFINPLNLIRALRVLSSYPHISFVIYNGTTYLSTDLPRSYVPGWLVVGSPPLLIVLALLTCGIFAVAVVRSRRIHAGLATVLLGLFIPLATLIILHPVLYNTLRHFLFLVPFIILLAAYGLVRSVVALAATSEHVLPGALLSERRRQLVMRAAAVGLVALTLVSYGRLVGEMIRISPYEYMYFSPLVGGIAGAAGNYDLDYWATCERASARWLGQHYQEYTNKASPTLLASERMTLTLTFLPSAFQWDAEQPDFYLGLTKGNADQLFPDYTVIHVESVEGVPLCVIKANPTSPSIGTT